MRTIHMGVNREPDWLNADKAIENWKGNNEMIEYWHLAKEESLKLRDQIIQTLEEDGECELSWSCIGRTRHEMHAIQWSKAMPDYDFEIGYNYECTVRKRGA